MKLPRRPSCVIYDLDGVLLDTEPFYTEVTQEIVGVYGKTFDWSIKRHMIGRPSLQAARYLVEALALPITAEDYLEKRRVGLERRFAATPAKPGAEAFTRALSEYGVAQAVATSSERDLYEIKITAHAQWFSLFGATVTGDDPRLVHGKPAPDIFLLAATSVGIDASQCVVFEDSPAGIEAAHAAAMHAVAVPDANMEASLFGAAELVIDSFEAIVPADLGF